MSQLNAVPHLFKCSTPFTSNFHPLAVGLISSIIDCSRFVRVVLIPVEKDADASQRTGQGLGRCQAHQGVSGY